jgi:polyphosphate glucokinase
MNVLVVDIGGTNVKILASGQAEPRRFPSGPKLTPKQMVAGVKQAAGDWKYDVVSIGYPGRLHRGRIVSEPRNLGPGWLGFDFEAAFKCPVKLMNDAAMQALGSYKGGTLLFVGLGTGLGSALVVEHTVVPMELGHLSYQKETYEDHVGLRGLKRMGKKKWTRHVTRGVERLLEAFHPDDVVLGGGNAKKLKKVPPGCRIGNNANAFLGGFRLWDGPQTATSRDPLIMRERKERQDDSRDGRA